MKDKIVKFLLFVSLTLMFVYFNYQLKFIDLSFTFENGLTFPILFIIMIVLTLMFLLILEPIPISFITITVPIILIIFSNLSNMNIEQALSGFSNGANITIMSMFVFSAGMQKSGLIQLLGDKISFIVGKKENKQVFIISLLTGSFAGFINNTPVVAALIPMVKDLAKKSKISMSKLLMPLSYSAMLGGTITLIGTSTNLLANQVLTRQLGRSYKMFEFTILGVICLAIGIIYLMTIGSKLIPDRMKRQNDLTDEYHMQNYLTKVLIKKDCEFVNQTVKSVQEEYEKLDFDIIKLIRDDEEFMQPLDSKMIRPDDFLIIRASHKILFKLVKKSGIKMMSELVINDDAIEQKEKGEKMVEAVIPNNSSLIGKTLHEMNFLKKYNCNVLAIRRGKELTRNELDDFIFKPGDLILILVTNDTFKRLRYNDNFIVGREYDAKNYDTKDM
ncbi:MAG: SLC13 family permease, partial [Bacillota bacterium]